MNLSEKVKSISSSPTLALNQKAGEMRKKGIDIVNFGVGEPDFDTPRAITESAKSALDEGLTRYSPVAGMSDLKEAISKHIFNKTDIKYEPGQIITTCGAKSALYLAFQALLNPGDEVLVPAPYWVSYPDQINLAGGIPRIIETKEENALKVTTSELDSSINDRTKILLINSPSNPTGSIYTRDELNTIMEICASKKVAVLADEIYDQLVYDGEFCSAISSHPSAVDHTIYINGVSKNYAMTGWRMGFAAGPENVIKAMTRYQSQLLTCIPPFVQKASITALLSDKKMTENMYSEFKKRRDLTIGLLASIPNITCTKPGGAFYAFPNINKYLGTTNNGKKIVTSQEIAEFLLDEAQVAVVPGSSFGMEGYLRISFACSVEDIEKGIGRIKEALSKMSK